MNDKDKATPQGKDRSVNEYRSRSGQIAVQLGFITVDQLKLAMNEQVDDDLTSRPHRFLLEILFDKGWITREQIDIILDEIFKDDMRLKGKL